VARRRSKRAPRASASGTSPLVWIGALAGVGVVAYWLLRPRNPLDGAALSGLFGGAGGAPAATGDFWNNGWIAPGISRTGGSNAGAGAGASGHGGASGTPGTDGRVDTPAPGGTGEAIPPNQIAKLQMLLQHSAYNATPIAVTGAWDANTRTGAWWILTTLERLEAIPAGTATTRIRALEATHSDADVLALRSDVCNNVSAIQALGVTSGGCVY